MKTLVILVLMGMSLSVFADEPAACAELTEHRSTRPPSTASREDIGAYNDRDTLLNSACDREKAAAGNQANLQRPMDFNSLPSQAGASTASRCNALINAYNNAPATASKVKTDDLKNCENLKALSGGTLVEINPREFASAKTLDGAISCKMMASYTIDYASCEKAAAQYNFVLNAETAMDLQQKIRTDLKSKSIQEDAAKQAAEGNLQEGALDAGIANHKHMKQMNTEKMAAYGMAVAALVRAYTIIPGEKVVKQKCASGPDADAVKFCDQTIRNNKPAILANQEAKGAIGLAIAKFTAKGIAAGIAMGQNMNAAKKIEQAKNQYDDGGEDVMMERCTFNPTDPACAKPGNRVAGQSFAGGEFGLGAGGNNAFDMTADGENLVEEGAATDLSNNGVSGINSPFAEEAKNAQKIVDPAAAAQMQASGGAAGGGAGGGSGGGGGSASLGSDLAGADKDGDKEASIKTNKVSGVYGSAGGSGYKGVGKGKDDANPFASLFDAKSNGGIEEDRSIASGDIDGSASGLFQKISKRYSQIQADKRIETKNLE